MSLQRTATIVSSLTAFVLVIIKLTVGLLSGSIAVLSSAIDSLLDSFVSVFNFIAVKNAEKEADEKFNYGRGKIEALASLIEGIIITLS
jgi:cation diffusion facilitator family transporter